MLALFLAAFIGPGQISPDLANNALSLYLARPFSRVEYVLGKMSVLLILMSVMTWVPGLLLFGLQGVPRRRRLDRRQHPHRQRHLLRRLDLDPAPLPARPGALRLGEVEARRRRPRLRRLLRRRGFGATINAVQRTNWGSLFNISYLIGSVWVCLFEGATRTTNGAVFFRVRMGEELPYRWCWVALLRPLRRLPLHAGAQDSRRRGSPMTLCCQSCPYQLSICGAAFQAAAGFQPRPAITRGLSMSDLITFANVSRFYGEVLGINKVSLAIPPGITSLVGPNGSGKTTLMNLMTGLIRPTQGEIRVLGVPPDHPEELCRIVGYCAQFDAFPKGLTGYQFIYSFLRLLRLRSTPNADKRTNAALERVCMTAAADRPVAAYSKGMRQRIKLAQAIAHDPHVLVLDEPLNGLDPMARAETIALFQEWGEKGRHVIVSSHILHEVDRISDQVILLSHGYVVAEGQIQGVRSEVKEQPMQIVVRCDRPGDARLPPLPAGSCRGSQGQRDGNGLLLRTRTPTASTCC